MKRAVAFAPAHITGFFEIYDSSQNPLLVGSRGAGVSLNLGVYTLVEAEPSRRVKVEVRLEGRPVDYEVTKRAVEELLKLANRPYRVTVTHRFQVPVGSGFGASGAGALSAALALNEALSLGLTKVEAAKAAHVAEVTYRTGLGDVPAQLVGGLEVRRTPGAPGLGLVEKVPVNDLAVVCAGLGVAETRVMITEPSMKERINRAGRRAMDAFLRGPNPSRFIELSASFAEEVGFMDSWAKRLAKEAVEAGALGLSIKKRVAFALAEAEDTGGVLKAFKRTIPSATCFVAKVDPRGARVVER
ncbi:MAG: hypothetical protein DRJ97_06060 [Thermoprotei archaeon]|nr:MAG: hypothetical protein DRJ97_06060 [Thermoprotei archaeon]